MKSHFDPCLYHDANNNLLLLLYVDDVLLACSSRERLDTISRTMAEKFKVSSMGEIDTYLGIKIEREGRNCAIHLSQEKYIEKIGTKFDIRADGRTDTPLQTNWYINHEEELQNQSSDDEEYVKGFPYREMIGTLLFLAICTRLDIAYAVGYLSRYLSKPVKSTCNAAVRVVKFVLNTKHWRLSLGGCKKPYIRAYCDSDWAQCVDTRRSTSSMQIYFGNGCIMWSSHRQNRVTNSSAEAEFLVLTPCAQDIIWLRGLLRELGRSFRYATTIFCDNEAARAIVENPVHHKRTKMISVKEKFISETTEAGITNVTWIPSASNRADLGSKPLNSILYTTFAKQSLSGQELHVPINLVLTKAGGVWA